MKEGYQKEKEKMYRIEKFLVTVSSHYRDYPVDYRAVVIELLGKASALYFGRIQQLESEQVGSAEAHDEISEPISNMGKTALSPNLSFQGTLLMQSDHFLLPSSIEYYEGRDFGSVQDEI
ncbi:hypothetical protein GOBAR_AA37335 [Gossypium barbadense]|uniref:Uncharacterized protein n=1 Tax=Gossypium barbadense TaxID=3634 RepID=A0A2P5VX10_GOSBA|nr:hypothetical protein GOBAR_AA37335 [Gossypium barbadense]